jgi:hypothetical protein
MRLLLLGIELPNVTARFKAWITPILEHPLDATHLTIGPLPEIAYR